MTIKKLKEKLDNPFVLIAQGFAAGLILFWATAPQETSAEIVAPTETAISIDG